jgi:DNA-binding NtrC family response regulator
VTASAIQRDRPYGLPMSVLLAAGKEVGMGKVFPRQQFNVITVGSVAAALALVHAKVAPVMLLGSELDGWSAAALIPLLHRCDPDLRIILVCDESPLAYERKLRNEKLFYRALRPIDSRGREEIRQVVQCAFESLRCRNHHWGQEPCT